MMFRCLTVRYVVAPRHRSQEDLVLVAGDGSRFVNAHGALIAS